MLLTLACKRGSPPGGAEQGGLSKSMPSKIIGRSLSSVFRDVFARFNNGLPWVPTLLSGSLMDYLSTDGPSCPGRPLGGPALGDPPAGGSGLRLALIMGFPSLLAGCGELAA